MQKLFKNIFPILLSAVLFSLGAAQEVKSAALKPLPDAPTLLRQLQENQKQIEEIRKNYICTDDEEEYQLDKDGNAKKKEVKQYDFYFVEGVPIKRLISKEGVPLNERDRKKEDERVAKVEKNARERRAKMDRGENDKNMISIQTFLRAAKFQNVRNEQYKGHEVIAMDFSPNTDFKPNGLAESVANKLGGTVWIDESAHQAVRLEATLLKSQSAGMGLASVKEGTRFVLEQQKINDELWMPAMTDGNLGARILFKGIRVHTVERYSNYKKFKSDTRILGVQEVK